MKEFLQVWNDIQVAKGEALVRSFTFLVRHWLVVLGVSIIVGALIWKL